MNAVDLGIVPYDKGYFLQQKARNDRIHGRSEDVVFLLEHEYVITIGKRGQVEDLLIPEKQLTDAGIDVRRVNRGGKLTCHYPGQLVVYPIFDLRGYDNDIQRFVYSLEETIIRTLADYGVTGERIPKYRGVFVGNDKIAAVGIEVKNSVTMHGFSFNIKEDWSLYSLFVPCGIRDKGIAFLEHYVDSDTEIPMHEVKERIIHHLSQVFTKTVRQDGNNRATYIA